MEFKDMIIALVSSGIGGGLMQYLNNKRNARRDDFEKIVETWAEDNERLRRENEELRKQLSKMSFEMDLLKARVILLETQLKDYTDAH